MRIQAARSAPFVQRNEFTDDTDKEGRRVTSLGAFAAGSFHLRSGLPAILLGSRPGSRMSGHISILFLGNPGVGINSGPAGRRWGAGWGIRDGVAGIGRFSPEFEGDQDHQYFQAQLTSFLQNREGKQLFGH